MMQIALNYIFTRITVFLVRKPEGNRPFKGHRCKLEDDIKIDLKQTGLDAVDSIIWNVQGSVVGRSVPAT
jgi:hypothetical protein